MRWSCPTMKCRLATKCLGDLIEPAHVLRAGGKEYPVLSMTMRDGLVDQADKFKKRIASADTSSYKVVRRRQLVVGFPIDEGVLAFQDLYDAAIVSPAYGIWDLKAGATVSQRYLEMFLRSATALTFYKSRLRNTTARRRSLPDDIFLSLDVLVPPLAEQERIVKLLDEADELRKLRTQTDQRTATLIPALFHEIFEDRVYGKSKLPLVTYGEISSFITSGSRGWAGYYSNCGAKFIRVQNLTGNRLDFGDIAFVSPPDTAEARRTRVLPNDLLLAITGNTIGLSAFAPTDIGIAHVSQHVAIIRPKPGIDIEYLATFTALKDGAQRQIAELQYGQTKPGLSLAQVRSLHIPVPPLPLQKAFAARVAEIRELEAGQAASRQRLDALFQSMLHRAFNGEL